MAVAFYDYDLKLKPNKVMLNLEAMKIAAYHTSKQENIVLLKDIKEIEEYDKAYVFRNLQPKRVANEKDIKIVLQKGVSHYGLAYTGGIYLPMDLELEKQTPHIQLYNSYFRNKVLDEKLTINQVNTYQNSHYLRLRAGDYEMDLSKLQRKERVFIYDTEIEKINDWPEKLLYIKNELMRGTKKTRVMVVNGFYFTSLENIEPLTKISGFTSEDVHLTQRHTYKEFKEQFNLIADWVSPRNGIKYTFGQDINPNSNLQVVENLCLSINKYLYTKSIHRACEFIVDDQCEVSPLNKFQKDFQYWTGIRVGDQTLEQYLKQRNKKTYDDYYSLISKTPFKSQFDRVSRITKNDVKNVGWYYHD